MGAGGGGEVEVGVALILNILIVYLESLLKHICFFTSNILKIFIIIHHSFGMIIINGIGEGGGVEVGCSI